MVVIALMCLFLALTTDTFFTLVNLFDLLNISAVNVIFAAGLLVVLIAGGIDISFAVAASVVAEAISVLAAAIRSAIFCCRAYVRARVRWGEDAVSGWAAVARETAFSVGSAGRWVA